MACIVLHRLYEQHKNAVDYYQSSITTNFLSGTNPMQVTTSTNHLLISFAIFTAFLLSGCGGANADNQSNDNNKNEITIPVEVSSLSQGTISSSYASTAVLEAKEEAYVVARADGIVESILVEEGDYVEKGQVLAQLETERYRLNLMRAEANLTGLEKELDKIKNVHSRNLVSDDTFDKLVAQYDAAKAAVELAKLDLAETTITAPISGYIAERNAKVGNLTESFQRAQMFYIVQQKILYGIVHLPEKELPHVHKGQQASLALLATNDQSVSAFVERISPVIDPETGTFKVTLRVPNEDNRLKAGMFAQVKLNYDTKDNALLMPRKALINIDDEYNVFVVKDGIANKTPVTIGYQENGYVEILSGLAADAEVIVTGHHTLKDQAPIKVING